MSEEKQKEDGGPAAPTTRDIVFWFIILSINLLVVWMAVATISKQKTIKLVPDQINSFGNETDRAAELKTIAEQDANNYRVIFGTHNMTMTEFWDSGYFCKLFGHEFIYVHYSTGVSAGVTKCFRCRAELVANRTK